MKHLLFATALTLSGFCVNAHASLQDDLPDGFDAGTYVSRYQDLSMAFGAQHDADLFTFAKNHFLMNGRLEGREARSYLSLGLPADFKETDYIALNPDLETHVRTHGLNPIHFALSHFLSDGKKEGRAYKTGRQEETSKSVVSLPKDFDAKTYLALNRDVEAYALEKGFSLLDFAKEHYLTCGRNENRLYIMAAPLVSPSLPSPSEKVAPKNSEEGPKRPSDVLRAQQRARGSSAAASSSSTSSPSKDRAASSSQGGRAKPTVSSKPAPSLAKKAAAPSSIGGPIDDVPMTFDAASTEENFKNRYKCVGLKVTHAIGHRQKTPLPEYKREVEGLLTTPFLSTEQQDDLKELLDLINGGLGAKH
jgi:hypothetical protein